MPEGHTIHRLAKDHTAELVGQRLACSSPQGRFAEGAAALDGRTLERVDPYGKHLFYRWEGGLVVHVHLGLYGKFLRLRSPAAPPTYQARLRMAGDPWTIDLLGPTACELGDPSTYERIVARLGPDPLRRDADPERAWAKVRKTSRPIGQVLMDQAVLAGVGNVFRAESLFLHGIHPLVPAASLVHERWLALWETIVAMLKRGVREGRIITVEAAEVGKRRRSDITQQDGRYVYKQDRCRRCGADVQRWDLAGRWAYACPVHQPLPDGVPTPVHTPAKTSREGGRPIRMPDVDPDDE